jgi:hypothetical protein
MVSESVRGPYTETTINAGYGLYQREFSASLTQAELLWHWDAEDREIHAVAETDWLLQLDNEYPVKISTTKTTFIPAGVWHRLIKGSGALSLIIKKYVGTY